MSKILILIQFFLASNVFSMEAVPRDIWHNKILILLDLDDLKNFALTSKQGRDLVLGATEDVKKFWLKLLTKEFNEKYAKNITYMHLNTDKTAKDVSRIFKKFISKHKNDTEFTEKNFLVLLGTLSNPELGHQLELTHSQIQKVQKNWFRKNSCWLIPIGFGVGTLGSLLLGLFGMNEAFHGSAKLGIPLAIVGLAGLVVIGVLVFYRMARNRPLMTKEIKDKFNQKELVLQGEREDIENQLVPSVILVRSEEL